MTDDHQKLSKQAFLDEANIFLEQLSSESDRGAVLAGVSYIEELLLRLFQAKLLLTKKLGGYLFEGRVRERWQPSQHGSMWRIVSDGLGRKCITIWI